MRWLPFAVLLYVTAVLQTALVPFLKILDTVTPDLMVILAVYYAMHARRYDAMISCWIIGLMIDLCGMSYTQAGYSNLGISALALGLIGLAVVNLRELTFRESPASQIVITFAAKLALNLMVGSHMLYVTGAWDRLGDVFTISFWQAAYTALVALYGFWVLRRLRFILGVGLATSSRAR
ncbi:MAG TPA: rod shape-determining protein MreD [Phycisphaerae bacterium]|nr:rod shape-determining protein MreD [Phycisphaerae bacterium]